MSNRKFIVYETDLKYRKQREIENPDKICFSTDEVEFKYNNVDCDSLEYRISQVRKDKYDYLDLSGMNLKKIPQLTNYSNYDGIRLVKFLFINNNSLSNIDNIFDIFTNLEVLDISDNNIKNIPRIPNTLKELCCFNNKLELLPRGGKYLEILLCKNNSIFDIPHYKNLIQLECDNNKITNLKIYEKLKTLTCCNNPLTFINSSKTLEMLDCSDTTLTCNLEDFTGLKHLICINTNVTSISKEMTNIESLDIRNSSIKHIPFFRRLKKLIVLEEQNILISKYFTVLTHGKTKGIYTLTF